MVIFIAMALALNMQIKNVLPDLTKRPKKDKEYASAVIVDASNGIATPTHILAALVKLKIVDDAFVRNWGQGLFAQTVNLSGAAFDAHYTTVRASIPPPAGENDGDPLDERSQTSQEGERTELPDPLPDTSKDKPQETQDRTQDDRQDGLPTGKQNGQGNAQQNGQENGHQDGQQNGQQDAQTNLDGRWQQTRCITCNVANHCPGSSGTSQSCSHCSHNEHCCLKCPVVSHCIPVLREMQSGHLYNWSIHNFRQEFQHTKRSLQSRTDQNGRPDRPLDDLFCIRMGMHLQESDVIRAIEAVTEAISLTKISKKFTLFSLNQWQNSRHDVKAVENQNPFPFDVVRRREDIVLPVVINKHQLRVLKEGKSNPNTVLKEFNAAEGHIVLAHVKYEKAAKDFSVDIYDSSLAFLRNIRHEAERMIRKFLRDTRWWWIDDQAHPLPQGRFNWREDTAAQRDSTSCGIHTILNGWAVAFDLPLNPSPNLDRLHRAIEVMMHACYGAVDCETIVQFLHFIRWVHPKNPIRGHTFKKTCAFPGLRELDDHHTGMWYMQEAGCVWGGIPKPYGSDLGCIKCSKSNHCRLQSNHRSDGNGSKRVRSKRFSGVHFLQSAMRQGKKRQLGGKVDSARRRKKQRT
ncbi:hypothetical protein IWX90DRAFT_439291 [Phyllosticta citrichinensis]|uniref:Ubiquitin-like protease family profile domain-containing protein n=1 Tax=Phyllosticta citrichinensis TaxID=1130410 RepID=A0ABR1XPQ9_9PEZI